MLLTVYKIFTDQRQSKIMLCIIENRILTNHPRLLHEINLQ